MPNEFTKLAERHTGWYSLASGLAMSLIAFGLIRTGPVFAVLIGLAFAAMTYVLWRRGGLFRRIEGEVGDEPIKVRQVVAFLAFVVLFSAVSVVIYALAK
jgi:hypothetical protein